MDNKDMISEAALTVEEFVLIGEGNANYLLYNLYYNRDYQYHPFLFATATNNLTRVERGGFVRLKERFVRFP